MADVNGSVRHRRGMTFSPREEGQHGEGGESIYYNNNNQDFNMDDGLTAEFRHRIGLLPEEEQDLSDAFKARIGLGSNAPPPGDDEIVQEIAEVEMPQDIETEATLGRHKFSQFVKTHIDPAALPQDGRMYSPEPHRVPLLAKERELDRTASVVASIAIKRFCRDIPVPSTRPSIYSTGNPVMTVLYFTLDALKRRRIISPQCAIAHTHSTKRPPISRTNSSGMGSRPLPELPSSTNGGETVSVKSPTVKKGGSIRKIFGGGSVKGMSGFGSVKSRKGSEPQSPPPSEAEPSKELVARQRSSESSGPRSPINIEETQEFADLVRIVPVDDLDLAQLIVGLGILRKDLRDEIYCQLSFQVSPGNKSTESCHKAWVLHVLCAGCFMPSQELLQYYFSFLHDTASNPSAPLKEYAAQAKNMLHRTSTYGLRYHPPNFIEYQAVLTQRKLMLPITMPDGSIQTLEADSATTASEVCNKISDEIKLKDQFGFAVYISVFDKVSSLGNGSDHVMDAISECEQLVRTAGGLEEDAPWQLYFRKEIFTPWHDASFDPVSTKLIYHQIVKSVQSEEFRMRCEEEMVRFVSRRWYCEKSCGPMGIASGEKDDPLTVGRIVPVLHEYLPRALLVGGRSRDNWAQVIAATYEQMGFTECKFSRTAIKESVVESATRKWPLHFSGLFEACRVAGPPLPTNRVVLAVGCRGIFFLQEPYHVMMGLHYYEIVDVAFHPSPSRDQKSSGPGQPGYHRSASSASEGIVKQYAEPSGKEAVTIVTIAGVQWTFVSPNAETVSRLLGTFLDGLRRRSRWAVAIQEFVLEDNTKQGGSGGPSTFNLKQGDVVELMDETKQSGLREDWMYGRSLTSGQTGGFPFDCVYIFPTCSKPPEEFLAVFSQMSKTDATRLPRKKGALLLAKDGINNNSKGKHSDHSAI